MGLLAESKIRRKINNDPNNTKWSRDTTTFGQKILRSQGWQPGEFLGAQNAPHSELHTAANASFIRVVLKDDMKGLGFNRAKEDQVTGLDVFQDLLSRLNGKSEELIEVDQQARLAVTTHHYVERKWGAMRFVYGGLLIGDEMKDLADENTSKEASSDSESESESEEKAEPMEVDAVEKESKESKKEKKSKKRKAVDDDDASEQESESKSKKRRREEKDEAKAKKKEKKEKKAKKNKSKRSVEASDDESDQRAKKRKSKKDKTASPEDSEEDKAKDSKKSKKDKKEKKEKKKRRKEEAEASDSATSALPSLVGSGTSTPTGTGTSTPQGSRNFVRSRFIAQKRQAVMDTKALAQIFMIKA